MVRAERAHVTTGPCAALLERVGGDQQIFAELCDLFLDDAPKRLDLIRAALAAGDTPTLEREVHAFKGVAAAFDAEDVVTVARQLEQLAAAGDLDQAHRIWTTFEARSRALVDAVREGKGRA
jgi:HPt (histidine-containing phosphotransfer) domain-containing protein